MITEKMVWPRVTDKVVIPVKRVRLSLYCSQCSTLLLTMLHSIAHNVPCTLLLTMPVLEPRLELSVAGNHLSNQQRPALVSTTRGDQIKFLKREFLTCTIDNDNGVHYFTEQTGPDEFFLSTLKIFFVEFSFG